MNALPMKLRRLVFILVTAGVCASFLFIAAEFSVLPAIRYQQSLYRQQLALLRSHPVRVNRIPAPSSLKQAASGVTDNDPQCLPPDADFESIRVRGIALGSLPLVFLEFTGSESAGIFREGEMAGTLKIIAIRPGEVAVSNGTRERILRVTMDGPEDDFCRQISEHETVFNKKMLGAAALKLAGEANTLKLTPVGGQQRPTSGGLQINNVTQGGIMEEMGLRNNDVVCQVNGIRTDNLMSLLNIAQKLKTAKAIELELRRNNTPVVLKYSIR